jgi:hypothetical protein
MAGGDPEKAPKPFVIGHSFRTLSTTVVAKPLAHNNMLLRHVLIVNQYQLHLYRMAFE